MFGCSCKDGDSIEHYAGCIKMHRWATDVLGCQFCEDIESRRKSFLMLDCDRDSDKTLSLKAVRITAVYKVHNIASHSRVSARTARGALDQAAREAVIVHPQAMRFLHHRTSAVL